MNNLIVFTETPAERLFTFQCHCLCFLFTLRKHNKSTDQHLEFYFCAFVFQQGYRNVSSWKKIPSLYTGSTLPLHLYTEKIHSLSFRLSICRKCSFLFYRLYNVYRIFFFLHVLNCFEDNSAQSLFFVFSTLNIILKWCIAILISTEK